MKRIFGMFRVIGLGLVMLAIATTMTVHQAQAQFMESLNGLGQQIAAIGGFSPNSAPRKLFVNGLEFTVLTVSTPLGVTDALNRFQGLCHSVANVDLPETVRAQLGASEKASPLNNAGVVRQDAENEGFLACLDVGTGTTGEGLLDHLVEFSKTQNLRSLGHLRYAMARRGKETTTLVVLWTEGDAKLGELFPKNADAPGRDLVGLPRPSQGRRLLSAFEQGKPFGIAAYRIEGQGKAAVLASYKASLGEQGWRLLELKNHLTVAEKDGKRVLVQVTEKRSGVVFVNISDLG